MDLIRELKDVRFELNLRGYDCDAVDAFLAKIRGEIAELQSQREQAQERLSTLESQMSDGESDTEGTLRRTLVLAQRLADETVADAKQSAESMVESAASEAAKLRAASEAEADSMLAKANREAAEARETGQQELDRAHEDAARMSEQTAIETKAERDKAMVEAERILAEAEASGMSRVEALEQAAKDEISRTREPIREEIKELEQARGSLLVDIDALEEHLTEQRTRVRTAVEALRAGMSGSIDDLERVATDDVAMTPAPKPDLSSASAASVAEAPNFDVADSVTQIAEPAPTVAELANAAAAASAAEIEIDGPEIGDPEIGDPEIGDVEIDDSEGEWTDWSSHSTEIDEAEVIEEDDPTELIPVVSAELDDQSPGLDSDDDGELLVDLDAAPSALFGTDVSAAAEVVDARSSAVDVDTTDTDANDGTSFLDRFGQAMGDLPIVGKR